MAKTPAAPASSDAPSEGTLVSGVPVGKGRATPSRAEQEAARKRPLVPDTKEAKARAKADLAAQREKARVGMAAGDPKYLPARDQGPQRKFVRDFVDGGWHLAYDPTTRCKTWTSPLGHTYTTESPPLVT